MTIKVTVPNTSSDSLTFGSANTPTAAQVIGIDSGSSNGQLAFNTTASGTSTERMRIDASGNVGIGTSSPSYKTEISAASATNGIGLRITNSGSTGAGVDFLQSGVDNFSLTMPAGSGGLRFIASGSNERMRIDSSGNLLVRTTTAGALLTVDSVTGGTSSDKIAVYGYGNGVGYGIVFRPNTNTNAAPCRFLNAAGSEVGYIATTSTNTSYVTSSDYRLKENIAPMTGALATVAQLNPVTYTWKADGADGQGFIAHELQAIVPDAVVGEKDAVDEEGNPKYQGIDTSFLVATLTAALQEAHALIKDLQTRVNALENK